MSGNIDLRAVGRQEGLLMAVSWVEAMEREAWKRRDRWLRSSEYEKAGTSAAVAAELRLVAADLSRKASEQTHIHVVGGCPQCDKPAEDWTRPQDGPQADSVGILHCSVCGGSGLVGFGLPSDGPVPCPECGP